MKRCRTRFSRSEILFSCQMIHPQNLSGINAFVQVTTNVTACGSPARQVWVPLLFPCSPVWTERTRWQPFKRNSIRPCGLHYQELITYNRLCTHISLKTHPHWYILLGQYYSDTLYQVLFLKSNQQSETAIFEQQYKKCKLSLQLLLAVLK